MSIVYRDKTFCRFADCADFDKCSRRLTESVKQAARLSALPICQFAEQPGCFVAKKSPQTGQG